LHLAKRAFIEFLATVTEENRNTVDWSVCNALLLVMPKLLFLVNHPRWFVTHRLSLGLLAQQSGFEVHVASPSGQETSVIEAQGIRWHEVPLHRSSLNLWKELQVFQAIRSVLRAARPDLVHNVTAKPVLLGTVAARRELVPAVVNSVTGVGHLFISNELRFRFIAGLFGIMLRWALVHPNMRVLFQNQDDLELYVEKGFIRDEEALLLPGGAGVDVQRFTPSPPPLSEIPTVILPARLLLSKGVVEFVEAARLLRSSGVKARFALVGEPDSQNPATISEERLREWTGEGVVEWWGFREDMNSVYASADVVVLPSYREGAPKALLEAGACGRAVVTTDVPGCRDVVEADKTAVLVAPRDPVALASGIRRLLDDGVLREDFGRRGRALAELNFSTDIVNSRIIQLYRRLLEPSVP
jgi:glycosyltransferase involved in cell wall biosynthesis